MPKKRSVTTAGAALAPPASSADRLPVAAEDAREISMADALQNSLTGLGMSRDKRFYSDYALTVLIEHQLRARYRSSWLAASIVDVPVDDIIRAWVTRKWKDATPEDQAALKRAETKLEVKSKFRAGMTWASVFGGGALIPMIRGQEDYSQPLNLARIGKDDLLGFTVKDKTRIIPQGGAPDRIPGPNFGKPIYYNVVGADRGFLIHWSWVIRLEGRLVPENDFLANNYWGDSELQHVDNALKDFDGAVDNVSAMMWEAKVDVIKTSLAMMIAAKDGGASILKRYTDAAAGKGNHRILLLNKDEEYDSKVMQFGGVHDLLGDYVVFACGAARIPLVKLFGQSAPGLSSTGQVDEGLYYDRLGGEREWKLLPSVARADEILIRSALGRMPEEYELVGNPFEQINPKDKADIELKRAQRDDYNIKNGTITPGLAARQAQADGTYPTMTDQDVEDAEELDDNVEPVPGNEPAPAPAPGKKGQPPAPEV
jgi:phage-related protein (TIGR01555 family)